MIVRFGGRAGSGAQPEPLDAEDLVGWGQTVFHRGPTPGARRCAHAYGCVTFTLRFTVCHGNLGILTPCRFCFPGGITADLTDISTAYLGGRTL